MGRPFRGAGWARGSFGEGTLLPVEPQGYESSFYLYTLLPPREWGRKYRDRLMEVLKTDYNVECVVANPPVHNTVPYIAASIWEAVERVRAEVDR